MNGEVPVPVEYVSGKRDRGEFLVADFDTRRVVAFVECGVDLESLLGRGAGDELDHDSVGGEGAAAPVHGDEEESVFDLYLHRAL